jgi:single-strand DNA-binding protein
MNKIILSGFLGKDPELRYIPSGKAVAKFSLATNEYSRDANKKEVAWHNIVVWDKAAENCAKYLSKGAFAMVEGRIQYRSYDDKDGNKRYVTEVVALQVEFGPRASGQERGMPDLPDGLDGKEQDDDVPF